MKFHLNKTHFIMLPLLAFWILLFAMIIIYLDEQTLNMSKNFLQLRLLDSVEVLRNADYDLRQVRWSNEQNALLKCRALNTAMELTKGQIDLERLNRLARDLKIDEYHITDEKGIVRYSNLRTCIGYDFDSSSQSRVFLDGINDPNFEYIQTPMPRGKDGKFRQYAAIARTDSPGIVQVGSVPQRDLDIFSSELLEKRMQSMRVGEHGFILILRNGRVAAAEDSSYLGKSTSELKISEEAEDGDFFTMKIHGRGCLACSENYQNLTLIAVLPEAEVFQTTRRCLYAFAAAVIIGMLGLWWLLNRRQNHDRAVKNSRKQ